MPSSASKLGGGGPPNLGGPPELGSPLIGITFGGEMPGDIGRPPGREAGGGIRIVVEGGARPPIGGPIRPALGGVLACLVFFALACSIGLAVLVPFCWELF